MESEQQQNNIIKCPQSICFDKTTCVTTKLIVKDYPTKCLLLNLQLGTCSFVFVDRMTDHNRQCISPSPTKKAGILHAAKNGPLRCVKTKL